VSTLGINGLGRIGKLAVWYEVAAGRFDRLVVNPGRTVGKSIDAVAHYLSSDSTFGTLGRFLRGHAGPRDVISVADREAQVLEIDGIPVKVLTENRNPREIGWADHGVTLVVDTTGKFRDPTLPADHPGGSLQGHLEAGAQMVLISSAFKIKDKTARIPDDSVMLIYGINHRSFDAASHSLVSAASCTTTALAHMMLPLLQHELTHRMLTASMSTIHAATNSQSVLDSVPKSGAKDLRKNRSVMNNIILTSTNAAAALEGVMPEISSIGFLADSVRIPTSTASLIILNCTFQSKLDSSGDSLINRDSVNRIYADFAADPDSGVLYTEDQNVSTDMIGELAAVAIEGWETHARTGFTRVDLGALGLGGDLGEVEVPVTHLKLFGWYDNELGSYTKRMSQLCHYMADHTGL
jgi:glyceraldehyde 3-phosphate dehydrogenase